MWKLYLPCLEKQQPKKPPKNLKKYIAIGTEWLNHTLEKRRPCTSSQRTEKDLPICHHIYVCNGQVYPSRGVTGNSKNRNNNPLNDTY